MGKKEKLKKKRLMGELDFILVLVVTMLIVFGVVMVFSASYYNAINEDGTPYSYLWRQVFYAVSGFALMVFFALIDYHTWRGWAIPLAFGGIVMLLLLFTPLGVSTNGATRWLWLGVASIMPGEFAKPIMVLFCAAYFAKDIRRAATLSGLLPAMIYAAIVCFLIYKQPNLSTAMTVAAVAVGIAFLAGMKWHIVAAMIAALGAGIYYIAFIDDGYQHQRVMTFLDPFKESLDSGYQVVQSLLALGTGGLTGVGLGRSVQKNLYLPEAQNDFILSIIGEELGFLGIAILLGVFVVLIWRLFMISVKAPDNYGMLIAGGTGILIGVQVLFNVAVVTSSMPPTGVALPFISYGGNAMWVLMSLIGVCLNVSRQIPESVEKLKQEKSQSAKAKAREKVAA